MIEIVAGFFKCSYSVFIGNYVGHVKWFIFVQCINENSDKKFWLL